MASQLPTDVVQTLTSALPPTIWYLTSTGGDMWCKRPYTFFFSSGESAEAFGRAMGSGEALFAVGMDAPNVMTESMLTTLHDLEVTRIFLDPEIDPESGDVFGKILRLEPGGN